jgi:signal transduction histidine kinase
VGDEALRKPNLDIMIFGKGDGMRSSDCSGPSQPNGTRMPDGSLWFATTQGFVHTTAYAEAIGPLTPSATIEGWTFAQDRSTPLISGNALTVEPGQTDVRIIFNARYLANPDRIDFRYRLKGYDADWTVTRFRMAHYQHLTPGHYEFEVQARMGGAAWNSPAAVLSVCQNPHFYQAWYFYTGVSALCILIGVALYRRRLRQVRASVGLVMEERNRIARECHDTLMAGFSAVSWQIEATSKQLEAGTVTEGAVASCDLARSMLLHCQAEARRIIWDLRDSDEITGDLSMALRRAIDAHYRQNSVQVKFSVTGNELELPPSTVHHLVCIGQEAIANALRHASPSLIEVQLQFQTAAVRMQIQDDGCGFQPNKSFSRQGHFGVVVMEERARKLGGDLTLQSQIGKGTIVAVRIPFLPENDPSHASQISGNSIVRWIGI